MQNSYSQRGQPVGKRAGWSCNRLARLCRMASMHCTPVSSGPISNCPGAHSVQQLSKSSNSTCPRALQTSPCLGHHQRAQGTQLQACQHSAIAGPERTSGHPINMSTSSDWPWLVDLQLFKPRLRKSVQDFRSSHEASTPGAIHGFIRRLEVSNRL